MSGLRVRSEPLIAVGVLALVTLVYWPGLHGGFLFDDFINLVENPLVRGATLSPSALWQGMWSSPSQELQRPLTMLSFALGSAIHGFDPFWFKVVNVAIHLLNTALVACASERLLRAGAASLARETRFKFAWALALGWAVLPINLTPVLYVVQRMESLAATFVFLGLFCYLRIRQEDRSASAIPRAMGALAVFTAIGVAAKESAAVLPALAFACECLLLKFRNPEGNRSSLLARSWFGVALLGCAVAAWVVYEFSTPSYWLIRDFDLPQRLLTESRVLFRYACESFSALPGALGFYYDDMSVSKSMVDPPATIIALLAHLAVLGLALALARRRPLFSLGIAWFYLGHAMTAGPLPLELAYEHRNYLASFGLLLSVGSLLAALESRTVARRAMLAAAVWLMLLGAATHIRAREWSHPYRLALANAAASPESSRAHYDLGIAHLVQSNARDSEPDRLAAMKSFRRAAALGRASAAPLAALVTVDARRGVAPAPIAWEALQAKLRQGPIGHVDVGVLKNLAQCVRDAGCALTSSQVGEAYESALVSGRDSPALYLFYLEWALAHGNDDTASHGIVLRCLQRHPASAQCKREAAAFEAARQSTPGA